MSWLFGVYSKKDALKNSYKYFHEKSLEVYQNKKYYVAVGGFSENIISEEISETKRWIVCGRGIIRKNNQFAFMGKKDWNDFYFSKLSTDKLNGHFVFVKWDNNEISIENDELGLRELFYYQNDEILVFSTKLDIILKFVGKSEIDLKNFSGYVHFDMPLHNNTFIKNIHRLGAKGKIVWDSQKLTVQKSYWKPHRVEQTSIIKLLNDLTVFPLNQGKRISLALSGGIDSRTLLAFLLHHNKNNFEVHTWGNKNNLDVQIAKRIAKEFNLDIKIIKPIMPTKDDLISKYQKFAKEATLIFPASYMNDLTLEYEHFFKENMVIIDGGEGEYLRRLVFTKLYWFGKRHILNNDFDKIYNVISHKKLDVFKPEITKILSENSKILSNDFFNTMPNPNKIGAHNWIDLFMIRTRLINKSMANQARIDSVSVNYMPFSQPDLLNMIFLYPEKLRYKSKINKAIFKKYAPNLAKIPVEKNGVIIPFDINFISSNVKSRLKKKFSHPIENNFKFYLLDEMKEYIYDTFNSLDAVNFDLYDNKKINTLIDGYFAGEKNNANSLNWLLSFDVWRKFL